MKKLLSLLLILCMIFLSACGATPVSEIDKGIGSASAPASEPEQYDIEAKSVVLDMIVHDDGYYGMYADVVVSYYDGEIVAIAVDNPALLYFTVSSLYDNGIYLLKLTEGDLMIETLCEVRDALREKGDTENADKIDAMLEILNMSGPIIQAST